MDFESKITVDPEIRSGKPCINGTRITVYDILEYMASGMTNEEILSDFPTLKKEDLQTVLAFAASRERKLAVHSAA